MRRAWEMRVDTSGDQTRIFLDDVELTLTLPAGVEHLVDVDPRRSEVRITVPAQSLVIDGRRTGA